MLCLTMRDIRLKAHQLTHKHDFVNNNIIFGVYDIHEEMFVIENLFVYKRKAVIHL